MRPPPSATPGYAGSFQPSGGPAPGATAPSHVARLALRHRRPARPAGAVGAKLAGAAHIASLAGVVAFWAWLDHGIWFFGDEWDFLVDRGLGYPPASPHSIWFPHNEHWSTLPILAWRALFSVWHLSSYWPYLSLLFVVQVAVVHLAWRACRRAGASPWVSTAAALMLGLLGAGGEDFIWAFQVGFVGSVAFGLLALELLDRPARTPPRPLAFLPTGRDLAASASLLASLMCSTIGDAMVAGAAVLAFARLPWRRAVKVLWAPVIFYVTWFAGVGRLGLAAHSDHFDLASFTSLPSFVWAGLSSALGQAFGLEAAGAALLVGLAAWVAWQARQLWAEQPLVVALCAAVLGFYALAGIGRDISGGSPGASRYTYVAFSLLVPVVARLLSGQPRRSWPVARAGAAGLLLFCTLSNVGQARDLASSRAALTSSLKSQLFATGELLRAGVRDVSGPQAAPLPGDPNLQVRDIAQLEREGFLARPRLPARTLESARAALVLGVWDGLDMTLSHKAFFSGKFVLAGLSWGTERPGGPGCTDFVPLGAAPPVQVQLRLEAGQKTASVEVSVGRAPAGQHRHLSVFLVPPRGPAGGPVSVVVPSAGVGWLDDNAPGQAVALAWGGPGPLALCGLASPARR